MRPTIPKLKRAALSAALLVGLGIRVDAATIVSPPGGSKTDIGLSGPIELGDADRLREAISTNGARVTTLLLLDSKGGPFVESVRIAKLVRELSLELRQGGCDDRLA